MKSIIHYLIFLSSVTLVFNVDAQSSEEVAKSIEVLNQSIDNAVVNRDIATLVKHYADDFVFTHGTGLIDSKESWIKNIQNMPEGDRFTFRQHDSTKVELHNDVAILHGKLSVKRESKDKVSNYSVWYVRVFVLRKNVWQMISHRTYKEMHF